MKGPSRSSSVEFGTRYLASGLRFSAITASSEPAFQSALRLWPSPRNASLELRGPGAVPNQVHITAGSRNPVDPRVHRQLVGPVIPLGEYQASEPQARVLFEQHDIRTWTVQVQPGPNFTEGIAAYLIDRRPGHLREGVPGEGESGAGDCQRAVRQVPLLPGRFTLAI
jgi:hypothetical protein